MTGSLGPLVYLNLRKIIASRLPLVTLFGCLVMATIPYYVKLLSLNQNGYTRLSLDFGLTLITLSSVAASVVLGATALHQEVERKTILTLISHPISRLTFILGQFLANALAVGTTTILWALSLATSLVALGSTIYVPHLLCCIVTIIMAAWLCLALASTASVRCSPPLAGVIAAAVFTVGGLSSDFVESILVEDRENHWLSWAVLTFKKLLPQFDYFDIQPAVVHNFVNAPLGGFTLAVVFYTFVWVALLLVLADLLLSRKDY